MSEMTEPRFALQILETIVKSPLDTVYGLSISYKPRYSPPLSLILHPLDPTKLTHFDQIYDDGDDVFERVAEIKVART